MIVRRILLAGLPDDVTQVLAEQLEPRAQVVHVPSGQEALLQLKAGEHSLAVLNHQLDDMSGEDLLGHIRTGAASQRIPLIYCLAEGLGGSLPARLVSGFGVGRLLMHPLDMRELVDAIAHELGLPPPEARVPGRVPVAGPVGDVWSRVKDRVMQRVAMVENACHVLSTGARDERLRLQAEREAHKLAGSL
ncbi:MAG TPA: hypothetical protein VD902_10915, partial [Symbiobacteriaceae bacterium]|nr:hypothetical protein [Symbiobacteriaceae bacterium]